MPRKRTQRGRRPREGRLARSRVAHLRLDPKLEYFVKLAARKQRRTISSYLEWAAEQCLDRIMLTEKQSIADEMSELWDVGKIERYVKLASRHPDLLDHEEQLLWRLIRENQYVWPRFRNEQPLESLNIPRLRTCWDRFVAVAAGKASKSVLPQ